MFSRCFIFARAMKSTVSECLPSCSDCCKHGIMSALALAVLLWQCNKVSLITLKFRNIESKFMETYPEAIVILKGKFNTNSYCQCICPVLIVILWLKKDMQVMSSSLRESQVKQVPLSLHGSKTVRSHVCFQSHVLASMTPFPDVELQPVCSRRTCHV